MTTTTENKALPFLDHLEELRKRLFRIVWIYAGLAAVACYFSNQLLLFIQQPLSVALPKKSFFIATTASMGWVISIKIACLVALLALIPFLIWEFWRFVSPALGPQERKPILPIVIAMSLFFIGGMVFAYKAVLPVVMKFFISTYNGTEVTFLPDIEAYATFTAQTLFGFGALFDLPFLVLFLAGTGLVKIETMRKARRGVYVAAFVVGAILTPPEVISQTMMALPFIGLYELGLLFARLAKPRRNLE